MTDKEVFEEITKRTTDPKVMDLLRAGLADPQEMEDVKRAIRYGEASMKNPILRDKLYKLFDRLLNVVKDDSTTRQMVKQDLRKLHKTQAGDANMSEDLNTANVAKAVKHDCAKHVVHETWGKGQCIPEEHTLLDDGTVTHYDVMFDHGIEQDVPVENLTITVSESHMHASKKKKPMMETAASDTLKGEGSAPPKIADITPQEGGGAADPGKASKKDQKMPMEKLKAMMEKKLTAAEMKKREEIAKGIEKSSPGMPMGKKMAIATAKAKEVAEEVVDEASYSAKAAHAGKDIGKPGKNFEKIAKSAAERYGSEEAGKKVAGAVLAKIRAKHMEEAKSATVPKTPKEKSLAALAPPHDKITHADVMVGRGVGKKTMKEFVEKLAESLTITEATKQDMSHSAGARKKDQHYSLPTDTYAGGHHLDKALSHAKKKGYKINYEHNDGLHSTNVPNGEKPEKAHAHPDVTFHYTEYGADHTAPIGMTVHHQGAAAHDPSMHKKAVHDGDKTW